MLKLAQLFWDVFCKWKPQGQQIHQTHSSNLVLYFHKVEGLKGDRFFKKNGQNSSSRD